MRHGPVQLQGLPRAVAGQVQRFGAAACTYRNAAAAGFRGGGGAVVRRAGELELWDAVVCGWVRWRDGCGTADERAGGD